MTKEELIALGLNEDQAGKVLEAYKHAVPKTRFDEVNEAKKKAEDTVKERDKQLEDLKKASGDSEALKAQIAQLQADNKAAADKYAAELKAVQINSAVEKELTAAGAKNLKAVKALLEGLDKAELDGENVKGLADQIKKLKAGEDTKFLFNEAAPGFKGAKAGSDPKGNPGAITKEAFAKMGYKERVELMEKSPETYNALSTQID